MSSTAPILELEAPEARIEALPRFPSTRYQGSKRKVLPLLKRTFDSLQFSSAIDLYSGTGTVTLLLRLLGKETLSNDFLRFNQLCAGLFRTIRTRDLVANDHAKNLKWLIHEAPIHSQPLVATNYDGIFFRPEENEQIDRFGQNIESFDEPLRSLYVYAFGQALLKKRPYNLFHRANLAMRTKDVKRSFGNAVTWETPSLRHAIDAIAELRKFPFGDSAPAFRSSGINTAMVEQIDSNYDLLYLDPPYVNAKGSGVDYSDFYGFLEGLCEYSLFDRGDASYPHKPISKQHSSWTRPESALYELTRIRSHFSSSIIVMSYRTDGLPALSQIVEVLGDEGRSVSISTAGGYKYALSQTKESDEVVIVSLPKAPKMSSHRTI
jgi:adenine-specific DNA-methyltransferase